jgi:signal transduction histidine kinase
VIADAVGVAALAAATWLAIAAVGRLVVRHRDRVDTIGRQFALTAGGGALAAAAGAWLVVAVGDDTPREPVLALILAGAAALIARIAYVVGMAVGADVDRVSGGLMAVGEGDRRVRLAASGGDQVARLAEAGNRMIEQLALREAERDEAQATRHELVRTMVEQLRERETERDAIEEQRKHLFVGVSHDLRTPLAALQLLANAIRDELATPTERGDYAEQMLVQIASLTQLTEQVFELSRLEAGEVMWTPVQTSIAELLAETADQMRPGAHAAGIELVADIPQDLPSLELAPDRIARVVVNLVQNAVQHTPAGGEVRVAARSAGDVVEVEVADTGAGIAHADRAHVFEPFYRGGEGAARGGSGTGLGLAISRAIVEAHGGRIWLADTEHGSSVRFSLPR